MSPQTLKKLRFIRAINWVVSVGSFAFVAIFRPELLGDIVLYTLIGLGVYMAVFLGARKLVQSRLQKRRAPQPPFQRPKVATKVLVRVQEPVHDVQGRPVAEEKLIFTVDTSSFTRGSGHKSPKRGG